MVFPLKGPYQKPPVTGPGMGSPKLTPGPRCRKKLVPRRCVDAINVEVDERLARGPQQAATKGVWVWRFTVFLGGFIVGTFVFFANQSWDVCGFLLYGCGWKGKLFSLLC